MRVLEYFGLRPVDGEIGIEIELEGELFVLDDLKFWYQKNDGSLRGNNIEYVLRLPIDRKIVKNRLDYLFKQIEKHKMIPQPTERCGIHVHINCQNLSLEQVCNYAILYLILEDALVKWCGPSREGNSFCLRASDAEIIIDDLITFRRTGHLHNTSIVVDNNRYSAINFACLPKFGSLEFRSLDSTINIDRIVSWVEMLTSIKDASLKFEDPKEVVESISANGVIPFINQILGDNAKLLYFNDIEHMIMNGVRTVQDIAYVPFNKNPNSKQNIKPRGFNDWGVNHNNYNVFEVPIPPDPNRHPIERHPEPAEEEEVGIEEEEELLPEDFEEDYEIIIDEEDE